MPSFLYLNPFKLVQSSGHSVHAGMLQSIEQFPGFHSPDLFSRRDWHQRGQAFQLDELVIAINFRIAVSIRVRRGRMQFENFPE